MFVIKSNGEKQAFSPEKIRKWIRWSARGLKKQIDMEYTLLQEVIDLLGDEVTTSDIQQQIIKLCLAKEDLDYSRVAANLELATILKNQEKYLGIFSNDSFEEIFEVMTHTGLWTGGWVDNITERDLPLLNDWFVELSATEVEYWTVKQWQDKYSLKAAVNGKKFPIETPAIGAIGIALSLHGVTNLGFEVARDIVEGRLNLPTPMLNGGRNGVYDTISCCVIEAGDEVGSLDVAEYVASQMTAKKAGIGITLETRSKGDPVKSNSVEHLGKWTLFRSLETAVKKYTQVTRGGSATVAVKCIDPEIESILLWKTQRIDISQRIDKVDYNFVYNDDFVRAILTNSDWYLFSVFDAPEVHDNFHSPHYMDYVKQAIRAGVPYKKVNAIDVLMEFINSRVETSRFYCMNASRSNEHTPFIDVIVQSNLCMEIQLPTSPYSSMEDLVSGDTSEGEVAFCALAAANVEKISKEEYLEFAYRTVRTVHEMVLRASDYAITRSMAYNLLRRKSLGVGITGLAGYLYSQGLDYDGSKESVQAVAEISELHAYAMYKASQRMVEEGLAEAVEGVDLDWLPVDTMRGDYEPVMDWEKLRGKNRAHSVLVAHMPTESSAAFSGATNGVYPTRDRVTYKKARTGKVQFISIHFDETKTPAWDVNMVPYYQAIQDFTDQAISADYYLDFTKYENRKVPAEVMITWFIEQWAAGIKTAYYQNNKVSTKSSLDDIANDTDCTSCKL